MTKKFILTLFALIWGASLGVSPARAAVAAGSPGEQAATLIAIDQHEIEAGKAAKKHHVSEEIKQFADMMIAQHQQNLDDTKTVIKSANVDADETQAVKSFKEVAKNKLQTMDKMDDAQFSETYVKEMIAGHEEALSKLDGFIQNSNGALRDHFTKTREAVSMHLQHAKALSAGTRA